MLTWLGKLALLQSQGLSPEAVLKAWNSTTTNAGQIGGQKRTSVLALLKLSDGCQKILLEHLSEFGDKTMFLEDAFSKLSWWWPSRPRNVC